jgi:hypothetical protein
LDSGGWSDFINNFTKIIMHSKINKIIEEEVDKLMKKSEAYVIFQKIHYQSALQDLRTKAPQLTEEIVRVVVEEIEKVSDFADSGDTLKGRIINLLKK